MGKTCGLSFAAQLVFRSEQGVETAKRVDVGDLDPFADDPQVLLVTQALDGAFHRLDVEPDPAREVHRRDGQLAGPWMVAGHLQQGAHDLRLGVAKHQDLNLVLGVAETANELRQDPLGKHRESLDDRVERGAVEGEGDPVGERDRRRHPESSIEDRAFAEEVPRSQDRKAAFDHPDAFQQSNTTFLEQVRVGRRFALTEEDVTLGKRSTVLLDELTRGRLDRGIVLPTRQPRILRHARTIEDRARCPQSLDALGCPWSNDSVRSGREERTTKETSIVVEIDLDGSGKSAIDTPMPFLSHMLEQIARHGPFDLTVKATGDIEIDGHHTTEDVGMVLGRAVATALGDKAGIARYGWAILPMDEARATCTLDLSGRPYFVWEVTMPKAKIGTWDTELAEVFFEAFARGAACNLHVVLHAGQNLHHVTEICFKAFAKALRSASSIDPRAQGTLPSTKGRLSG